MACLCEQSSVQTGGVLWKVMLGDEAKGKTGGTLGGGGDLE